MSCRLRAFEAEVDLLRDENATLRDENARLRERVRLAETAASTMTAPTSTTPPEEADNWAVDRATSLPEVWALVAKHRAVLGAVCRAARAGGAGVSENPAGTRGVRRCCWG